MNFDLTHIVHIYKTSSVKFYQYFFTLHRNIFTQMFPSLVCCISLIYIYIYKVNILTIFTQLNFVQKIISLLDLKISLFWGNEESNFGIHYQILSLDNTKLQLKWWIFFLTLGILFLLPFFNFENFIIICWSGMLRHFFSHFKILNPSIDNPFIAIFNFGNGNMEKSQYECISNG